MMQKPEICSLPKSLAEARETGHNLYYTGISCKHGHDTYRYVADRACATCVKLKVKKAATVGKGNARRWANKTVADKEAIYAKRKQYYQQTILVRRVEKMKSYNALKTDPVRITAKQKAGEKWKLNNPGKVRAGTAMRRTAKMHRTPAWLSEEDFWLLEQAYELAALRTKLFGFSWHVDHIIPLQGKLVSGFHVPTNVQVIPGVENVSKANRYLPA